MKNVAFLIYAWGTTFLFAGIIYWLATIPNLDASEDVWDDIIKISFRMTLYSMLFILVYRSIIITLKNSVTRLSSWRSKREKIEDAEFVLLIETLVVVISVLSTILYSTFEEYTQNFVEGRSADVKDVLVSIMATLVTAIFVYTLPIIGELEVAIKHKFKKNQ